MNSLAPQPVNIPTATRRRSRWLRLVLVPVAVCTVAVALNRVERVMQRRAEPAGFFQGALQGALMPMALPNLLVGNDVPLYSNNNTGLAYKRGYTVGVNACGAFFFGLLFGRLRRFGNRR